MAVQPNLNNILVPVPLPIEHQSVSSEEKQMGQLPSSVKHSVIVNRSRLLNHPIIKSTNSNTMNTCSRPKKRGFFANINNHTIKHDPPQKRLKLDGPLYDENIILKKQNLELIHKANEWQKKHQESEIYHNNTIKQYGELHRKYAQLIQDNNNKIKQLQEMKKMIVTKHKLQINVPNLDILDLNTLNTLESNMENGLNYVREMKNKLIENKYLCIICCEHERNVSFSGCNHVVLCTQCEQKLESKKCPICQQHYLFTNKLQF